MHPGGVASAVWVIGAAPSKVPFYLAGGLLAGWAVVLAVTGLTHPDFPGSPGRARLIMLTSFALMAAVMTTAVVTAGGEREGEAAGPKPAGASGLQLTADPKGRLAYDKKQATVKAGKVALALVNRSSLPHNVTIAKGSNVIAQTKTITGATTRTNANLRPGDYVFYCSVDEHRQGGMQGRLTVK
jgi:plastocyanin